MEQSNADRRLGMVEGTTKLRPETPCVDAIRASTSRQILHLHVAQIWRYTASNQGAFGRIIGIISSNHLYRQVQLLKPSGYFTYRQV